MTATRNAKKRKGVCVCVCVCGGGGREFKSEQKLCTCSTFFLCISLPLFCTTSTYVKLPSCTFYGGKVVYVPSTCQFFFFFFLLPLILTLLAASICHFLIAALNFSCFFFRNELRLLSFLSFFLLLLFFALFCLPSSSFSVIGLSVVVAPYARSFSRIYRLPFFLSRARELR